MDTKKKSSEPAVGCAILATVRVRGLRRFISYSETKEETKEYFLVASITDQATESTLHPVLEQWFESQLLLFRSCLCSLCGNLDLSWTRLGCSSHLGNEAADEKSVFLSLSGSLFLCLPPCFCPLPLPLSLCLSN